MLAAIQPNQFLKAGHQAPLQSSLQGALLSHPRRPPGHTALHDLSHGKGPGEMQALGPAPKDDPAPECGRVS